jgi:iron transport multicopper oxidase
MAISLSYSPILSVLLLVFISNITEAAIVTYDFNITWVRANPDGLFERPTIGINGQWPLPVMKATIGDQVVVNVDNQLGNQSTSLHFHGLFQNGTTEMDGPAQVSQCAIPAGSQFTYNFTVSPLADAKRVGLRTHELPGKPSWYLLVSFSRQRPIPGWSSGTLYHQ